MKKIALSILIICCAIHVFAFTGNIDSLKQKLTAANSDSAKAGIYTQLALKYMNYQAIQDKRLKARYQDSALNYTLFAIRHFSRVDDTVGLRVSYDHLAHIYHDQKKFTQAKWFILQSNTLAREQNDVPNIVASLLTLATIKMDIKDYDLARGDLREALSLTGQNCLAKQQSDVVLGFADLYNRTHNKAQADAFLKRYAYMKDSMHRDSQVRVTAMMQARKKKLFSVTSFRNVRAVQTAPTISL